MPEEKRLPSLNPLAPMELEEQFETLRKGQVTLEGQFTLGSNYTFLVNLKYKQDQLKAVYKPQQGEQPLWDFPENTLATREVSAYVLSCLLGWDLVPPTLFRTSGPYGAGSYQLFIDYNPNYHYFTLTDQDLQKLKIVAAFDLISNNADRKGSHILFSKQGHHLYAIDHGLCFNEEDKLRTVIWNFAGTPIPSPLLDDIARVFSDRPQLDASFGTLLFPEETDAMFLRAQALLASGVYPHPPEDKRSYPYPPL